MCRSKYTLEYISNLECVRNGMKEWTKEDTLICSMRSKRKGCESLDRQSGSGGFDYHDRNHNFPAECKRTGSNIVLRGTVQCYSGVKWCFNGLDILFATLPAWCRPAAETIVTVPSVSSVQDVHGSIRISTDGTMRHVEVDNDSWLMYLTDIQFSPGQVIRKIIRS